MTQIPITEKLHNSCYEPPVLRDRCEICKFCSLNRGIHGYRGLPSPTNGVTKCKNPNHKEKDYPKVAKLGICDLYEIKH